MATENAVLMRQSQDALRGKWMLAIGTFLVYMIIAGILGMPWRAYQYEKFNFTVGIIGLIIGGPFALGLSIFSLSIARGEEAYFEQLFFGFKRASVAIPAYILVAVYTILWLLLLIVPGIVAAISYSQTFFIMADDNDIRASEAIDKSKKMMYGYKMKYFRLCLRYIGLALLCILTLGIGFLWLVPYMYVTNARFYEDIKNAQVA